MPDNKTDLKTLAFTRNEEFMSISAPGLGQGSQQSLSFLQHWF